MDFMDKKSLLNKLKLKRVALGLSQDEMAQAIGVGDSQYSKLERGDNDLTLPDFLTLMKRLDLSFDDLADGDSLPHQTDGATLKALIDTMNANNSTLVQAIGKKKFSPASEMLIEKLESLKDGQKIVQNMAFLVLRNPDLFVKQYAFDFESTDDQLSSEVQRQADQRISHQPEKHQKTKRQSS